MLARVHSHSFSRTLAQHAAKCQFLRAVSERSLSSASTTESEYFDVLIVGGGGVGCSMARLLNDKAPQLKVGLLEARGPPQSLGDPASRVPHPRSYALSPNSLSVLGENVCNNLPLGYYDAMQVWQANSPASVTFTTRDLNADPLKAPYLGACVEDGPLVEALWNEIQANTTCFTNTTLESLDTPGDVHSLAKVTTNNGQSLEAAVLVGADGGNSWIRKTLGVSRIGTEYEQHALTFTVQLDSPLPKRAFQRFLPDGAPMAMLPTYSPNHAVIVWSTSPENVRAWKDAPTADLVSLLNESLSEGAQRLPPLMEGKCASGGGILSNVLYGAEKVLDTVHYGLAMASHYPIPKTQTPPTISDIVSPKFSFPLTCYQSRKYVTGRTALVGDAAHTVHPMAGQGLNLGLGDVQALAAQIEKASTSGMDASTFLNDYASKRERNVSVSLAGMHTLQRLFGNQNLALLHAKTFGMNVIQNFGPIRQQLALAAAYGVSL
eukprot:Nitzschia sp. Nitz4//scaffold31_size150131//72248//73723//NITZ4_002831-RA/size150131-processed-gene-0.110-mRNA-1//1//CDS//3329547668//4736//frame0